MQFLIFFIIKSSIILKRIGVYPKSWTNKQKTSFLFVKIQLQKYLIILLPLKILVNNYFVPKEFYWDKFSCDWKNRDYRLESDYGCSILEIGEKGKYYYGRVSSDSGATFYRRENDDFTSCKKNEYYLILEKEKYLASLIIAEPIFAPYKNICFEVYRVSDEKIILFYYDNENTTLQQNIEQIDKMLDKFIGIN